MQFVSQGYETILLPANKCPYTGPERRIKSYDPNITVFKDPFGSYRFIYTSGSIAISGLQIMRLKDNTFQVANVITLQEYRLQGFAKALWHEAKRHFKEIRHSSHLSADGVQFAYHCK